MNYNFLDTLAFKNSEYSPIWLMRQAGRYLPEYRKIRERAGSFLNLCKNPDLATEVTLQPLRRFNLDAAIMFSDILVIPDALGLGLYFVEGEGPKFERPIINPSDIDKLTLDGMLDNLDYVFATINGILSSDDCKVPLIGFSGSPFTLFCYMVEGGSSKDYLITKKWLYNYPQQSHKLLELLSQAVTCYLEKQITAGVSTVMIFDSWGGILTTDQYLEFSLSYIKNITDKLSLSNPNTPRISFTKGGGNWLNYISEIQVNCIGLDWTVDLGRARSIVGNKIALQGNLDPMILSVGDRSAIKNSVIKILDGYKKANNNQITGHVFNLGHGILPSANPDNVAYLIDLVHEISSQ